MKSAIWHCVAMAACLSLGRPANRATAFSVAKLAARRPAAASPPRQARPCPASGQHPSSFGPPRPAVAPIRSSAAAAEDAEAEAEPPSTRSRLRRLTGFSLTAVRSALGAATGFSLTAFRAALRAATGISLSGSISGAVRRFLEVMTPGMRYFLQPLLIAYYAPALVVRYWMVGPSSEYVEESLRGHERAVEGWRRAVEAAEKASDGGYWPVHLNGELRRLSVVFGVARGWPCAFVIMTTSLITVDFALSFQTTGPS